jgi:N4-(beta-N-acetylglucosaminyl)-L-asparaginase
MPDQISRRKFLLWVPAAGAGLYGLAGTGVRRAFSQGETTRPTLLTSMDYRAMGDIAGPMLTSGQSGLDALDAAMTVVETDPTIPVGTGGYASDAGEVELDALVMSGPAHDLGAVAALKNVATPSRVARQVMENTPHVLLVAEGAQRFSRAQGIDEDVLEEGTRTQAVASLGAIALDANGDMWVAISASGYTATDPAGRMGAAALAGAGAYVDNDVGGAISWGASDVAIRFSCAYQVVENMRRGMPASFACNEVLRRIRERNINWDGGLLALSRHGDVGAVSLTQRIPFWIHSGDSNLRHTSDLASPSSRKSSIAAVSPGATRRAARRQDSLPLVVTSWYRNVNRAVGDAVMAGSHPLDAIAAGINIEEQNRANGDVGAGNNVNSAGYIELDAAVMSGPDHSFASIGGLQHIDVPISVAHRLLTLHPNTFLTGQGALDFALAQGFTYQESLAPKQAAGKAAGSPFFHDTVGSIVLDADRNFWVGMSTSGTGRKTPGRVGDSPQVGPGLYIDNEIGAAMATGVGEEIIRFVSCYQIVEYMRQGYSPTEAISFVINRMWEKGHSLFVAFMAVSKDGERAAVGSQTFHHYVFENGASKWRASIAAPKLDVPIITAVTEGASEVVPARHELLPNYPNPFNAATTITFTLARPEPVLLRVYDTRGAVIRELLDERRLAGRHRLTWDGRDDGGRDVASGSYFSELSVGGIRQSHKMTLVR